MKTSFLAKFLAKVDPLNSEAAYVGVVGLSLVLSVFAGMSLAGPDDELTAHMHHAASGTGSKADTAAGREELARSAPVSHQLRSQQAATASSLRVAEAKAVTTLSSVDKRQ